MSSAEVLIIGGGPAGLSAAYVLQHRALVLEKERTVGGLCRSVHKSGGVFDIGGHSFHTPHPDVYELVEEVLDGNLFKQTRDARIFTHGTLIPYPFQKHYDQVPDAAVVRACEEGLQEARRHSGAASQNFEEYILQKFGRGIADEFMLPYNRKLWARDLKRLACDWTSERVSGSKGETERFETSGGQRKPLQPDTVVAYPAKGGFEEIYRAMARRLPRVELDCEVAEIDPERRTATTAGGLTFNWRTLLSTMPIPELVRRIRNTPRRIIELADQLEYMSLRVELLLAEAPLPALQRIYVADPAIPPHKIAMNHNSSDHLRARPRHAITAEVSHSDEKPIDRQQIAPKTTALLCELGVLKSPRDIVWTGHIDVKYAYPVYTHGRAAIVGEIKEHLLGLGIHTLGRFGEWEYINSDKCIAKGLDLGRQLQARDRVAGAA
jgi:protoporphyrinogen oxidase